MYNIFTTILCLRSLWSGRKYVQGIGCMSIALQLYVVHYDCEVDVSTVKASRLKVEKLSLVH